MTVHTQKKLLSVTLGLCLSLTAGSVFAGGSEGCDPKYDSWCEPPPSCDPKKDDWCEPPPPPEIGICHNIGGPRDLGANCDGTGNCSYYTVDEFGNPGPTLDIDEDHFLGIIIGVPLKNTNAIAAHLAHGDGYTIMTFDPPLHLASTGQNHQASNVECLAERAITTQPDEPGN